MNVHEHVTNIRYAPHNGPKSLILAPQDIPDISGYQLGFGCQCVRAYNNENPFKIKRYFKFVL